MPSDPPLTWSYTLNASDLQSLGLGDSIPLIAAQTETSEAPMHLGFTTITFNTTGGAVVQQLNPFLASNTHQNGTCNFCEIDTVGWFNVPSDATSATISGFFTDKVLWSGENCDASYCVGIGGTAPEDIYLGYGCGEPTITSLSPKTWFAGESYDVTITGTGFTDQANASSACPVTPVVGRMSSGTLSLTNLSISPTQITFTVTPPANATTQNAGVTIGSSSNGGAVSVRTQILGNQIKCDSSMPVCGGNVISTADGSPPPTQNAVVGQQIALTTTTPTTTAYDGPTLTPTWTVGGTRIKNYAPTTASASVTELADTDLQTSNATFYWVYPNPSVPVTYQYCVNIHGANPVLQCSLPANATFNITGPTGINVIPSGQEFFIPADQLEMIWGIKFNATATSPNGYTGVYTWVQLVSLTEISDLIDKTQLTCTGGPGLDTQYPYETGLYAEDGPLDPIDPTLQKTVIETADFQMYFMWNPQTTGSIPVPLGSIEWSTLGSVASNSTNNSWTINSGQTTSGTFSTSSPSYPLWSPPTVTPSTIAASCK
jgi:hypothetical protein